MSCTKPRTILRPRLFALACAVLAACAATVSACAGSEDNGSGGEGTSAPDAAGSDGAKLPPPSNGDAAQPPDAGTKDAAKDAITDAKADGFVNTGTAPACTFGNDTIKLLTKLPEILNAAPCDNTCNATTDCCLDLVPGLPIDAGAALGTSVCVSKN